MPSDPILEITVEDLASKLQSQDQFVMPDVRESWELNLAKVADARLHLRPMSRLVQDDIGALPEAARSPAVEIYVLCYLGVRSADVAAWLASQGWKRVFSVAGGIDEYARRIDRSVGKY